MFQVFYDLLWHLGCANPLEPGDYWGIAWFFMTCSPQAVCLGRSNVAEVGYPSYVYRFYDRLPGGENESASIH